MKGWFFESELFRRVFSSEEMRRDGSQHSLCRGTLLAGGLTCGEWDFEDTGLSHEFSLLEELRPAGPTSFVVQEFPACRRFHGA
jgi:hypothetical protein